MSTVGKRPLARYKTAITLMYGALDGITPLGSGKVYGQIKEITHHLRTTHEDLKRYLQELEEIGVISKLEINRGSFVAEFKTPRLWSEEFNETIR